MIIKCLKNLYRVGPMTTEHIGPSEFYCTKGDYNLVILNRFTLKGMTSHSFVLSVKM